MQEWMPKTIVELGGSGPKYVVCEQKNVLLYKDGLLDWMYWGNIMWVV